MKQLIMTAILKNRPALSEASVKTYVNVSL